VAETRNYKTNAAGSPPSKPSSPSTGYPQTAVKGVTEATVPGPYWYYQISEELRNLILAGGLTPDHALVDQASAVIEKVFGRTNSGDPNGVVAADRLHERLWDTSAALPELYIATAADGTVGGTTWTPIHETMRALKRDPATATDAGTDAYQVPLGFALAAGEVFQAVVAGANGTDAPTLENTSGAPSGGKPVVDASGNAWVGALEARAHSFQWDNANDRYIVLDPNRSGWVLLASAEANDDSSVDFTKIDTTYDTYAFVVEDACPVKNDRNLHVETSSDGGNNFDAASGDYKFVRNQVDAGGTDHGSASSNASGVSIVNNIGDAASGGGASAVLYLRAPSLIRRTRMDWIGSSMEATNAHVCRLNGAAQRHSSTAVDAFRFRFNTGNIDTGRFRMYGVRG